MFSHDGEVIQIEGDSSPLHEDLFGSASSDTSTESPQVSPEMPAQVRFYTPFDSANGVKDSNVKSESQAPDKRRKLDQLVKEGPSDVIDLTSDVEDEIKDENHDSEQSDDEVIFVGSTTISHPEPVQPHQASPPVDRDHIRDSLVKGREHLTKLNEVVKSLIERRTSLIKFTSGGIGKLSEQVLASYHMKISNINNKINDYFKRIRETTSKINLLANYEHTQQSQHFQPSQALGPAQSMYQFGENSMNRLSNLYAFNPYMQRYNDNSEADNIKDLLDNIRPDEEFEDGIEKTPEQLSIGLLKHQRIGLKWMLSMEDSKNKGGILADDMGLGKTVQAIALMVANSAQSGSCNTNLVVAPVSLLQQWGQELEFKLKKEHQLNYYIYHQNNRLTRFKDMSKFDVVLVSYNTLTSEMKKHYKEALEDLKNKKKSTLPERGDGGLEYESPFYTPDAVFRRIFLDEAQSIKNKLTQGSKAVALLKAEYRWCLSGTPIQNNIDELFPILRFLEIKPYCDEKLFKERISNPLGGNYGNESRALRTVQALLSAILLRRTKSSLIDGKPILQLPEKHVVVDHVEMKADDREFYLALEAKSARTANQILNTEAESGGGKGQYSEILTLLLRLRQACDHRFLVQIGQDKEREFKADQIKNGFKAARKFTPEQCEQINEERGNGFTCQMCFEVIEADMNVILLGNCGHSVCKDCVEQFFEDNQETVWNGDRSARCKTCEKASSESLCVELPVFDAVCNKQQDWKQVQRQFNIQNQTLNSVQRAAKVKELIESEGGGLVISAKIERCLSLINDILINKPGEKIIIFSQFMVLFDILELFLQEQGIEFLRYDGSMNVEAKSASVATFYQNDAKRVMLLSLKAGNVGLTLTCASHVIILEPFWNPFVERQAQDRVHRISQEREVYVHRILIRGTVEDRIMDLQAEKEKLVDSALDPSARKTVNRLSRVELGFLFGLNGLSTLENE